MRMFTRRFLWLIPLFIVGCGVPEKGISPMPDSMHFPLSLSSHPNGRYLYVSSAVFDRRYHSGTLSVVDTHAGNYGRILPNATVEIGLFSGELQLAKRPCEPEQESSVTNTDNMP